MFGGFFSRMYYGNPNKPDLKKEDMPKNRFKLFFIVLQVRFWKLIQLNLLYSIFWVPAFFVTWFFMELIRITDEPLPLMYFIILIPCFVIAGPATAGVTYVIRNWARDEHAWVWDDFKDAWKQNWKESLLVMLINGIALLIFYVNVNFYRAMADRNMGYMVLQMFILVMGLIYAMMNMFIFPMLVTYKLTVKQIFKNALIFTIAELPRTFAIFILAAGLFMLSLWFIPPFLTFIFGFTFPALITISYTNWVFDKYMNSRIQEAKSEQ